MTMRPLWLLLSLYWLGGCGGGEQAQGLCMVDGECPLHQFCRASTASCVSGCLGQSGCSDGVCNEHGRCVASFTGGGGPDDAGDPVDLGASDLAGEPPVDLAGALPDLLAGPDGASACSG